MNKKQVPNRNFSFWYSRKGKGRPEILNYEVKEALKICGLSFRASWKDISFLEIFLTYRYPSRSLIYWKQIHMYSTAQKQVTSRVSRGESVSPRENHWSGNHPSTNRLFHSVTQEDAEERKSEFSQQQLYLWLQLRLLLQERNWNGRLVRDQAITSGPREKRPFFHPWNIFITQLAAYNTLVVRNRICSHHCTLVYTTISTKSWN